MKNKKGTGMLKNNKQTFKEKLTMQQKQLKLMEIFQMEMLDQDKNKYVLEIKLTLYMQKMID